MVSFHRKNKRDKTCYLEYKTTNSSRYLASPTKGLGHTITVDVHSFNENEMQKELSNEPTENRCHETELERTVSLEQQSRLSDTFFLPHHVEVHTVEVHTVGVRILKSKTHMYGRRRFQATIRMKRMMVVVVMMLLKLMMMMLKLIMMMVVVVVVMDVVTGFGSTGVCFPSDRRWWEGR